MKTDKNTTQPVISFSTLLLLLFITLKLCHVIDWSWWWVTAPAWGPIVLAFAIAGFCFLMAWITGQLK